VSFVSTVMMTVLHLSFPVDFMLGYVRLNCEKKTFLFLPILGGKTDTARLQSRSAYHVSKMFCHCALISWRCSLRLRTSGD